MSNERATGKTCWKKNEEDKDLSSAILIEVISVYWLAPQAQLDIASTCQCQTKN